MALVSDRHQDMCSTLVLPEYVSLQDLHILGNIHELFILIIRWRLVSIIHILQMGKQMHQGLASTGKSQNLS